MSEALFDSKKTWVLVRTPCGSYIGAVTDGPNIPPEELKLFPAYDYYSNPIMNNGQLARQSVLLPLDNLTNETAMEIRGPRVLIRFSDMKEEDRQRYSTLVEQAAQMMLQQRSNITLAGSVPRGGDARR